MTDICIMNFVHVIVGIFFAVIAFELFCNAEKIRNSGYCVTGWLGYLLTFLAAYAQFAMIQ